MCDDAMCATNVNLGLICGLQKQSLLTLYAGDCQCDTCYEISFQKEVMNSPRYSTVSHYNIIKEWSWWRFTQWSCLFETCSLNSAPLTESATLFRSILLLIIEWLFVSSEEMTNIYWLTLSLTPAVLTIEKKGIVHKSWLYLVTNSSHRLQLFCCSVSSECIWHIW